MPITYDFLKMKKWIPWRKNKFYKFNLKFKTVYWQFGCKSSDIRLLAYEIWNK